jgi:hypothetical protein
LGQIETTEMIEVQLVNGSAICVVQPPSEIMKKDREKNTS